MSDTALALLITVLGLLALAAWVPLLHASQTAITRLTERDVVLTTQEEQNDRERKAV